MKPETIARRAAERVLARKRSSEELERRLQEKAEAEGPGSIWAEMLAERAAR